MTVILVTPAANQTLMHSCNSNTSKIYSHTGQTLVSGMIVCGQGPLLQTNKVLPDSGGPPMVQCQQRSSSNCRSSSANSNNSSSSNSSIKRRLAARRLRRRNVSWTRQFAPTPMEASPERPRRSSVRSSATASTAESSSPRTQTSNEPARNQMHQQQQQQ